MLAVQLYYVLENIEIVTHAVYMRLGVPGGTGSQSGRSVTISSYHAGVGSVLWAQ